MRVITAPESWELDGDEIAVFLAGGICKCPDWQKEIIDILSGMSEEPTMKLVIFNPRRENFPIGDPNAAHEQIEWEFHALEACDIFSMYFCGGESDQPICMYELGRNIARMQMRDPLHWDDRIVISCESGYKRANDVKIQTSLATDDMVGVLDVLNGWDKNNDKTNEYLRRNHALMIERSYRKLVAKLLGE